MSEEQALQARSSRPRLFQLDALRGLAALMVVFNHLLLAVPRLQAGPLTEVFTDGRSAVVLFFVLSGYVLSLPHWARRPMPYGGYLVRRFCRIYLPFAAAAVLAVIGAIWFAHSTLALTPWFNQTWHTPVTGGIVVKQFLMVPMNIFNTAFWSLTYEMQMSIVMPLVCLVMIRARPAYFTLVLTLLIFAHPMNPYGNPQYFALSYQIFYLFVLGAALARYEKNIRSFCERIGAWLWLLLPMSLFLFYDFVLHIVLHIAPGTRFTDRLELRIFLINGLGAAGLLICSLHLAPLAHLLKHSIPEYLGRISYSLYLTHATVLFALFDQFWVHMRQRWLILLFLSSALVAAHFFCIAVEEPSMRLGKKLYAGAKRPT
jgi:peptidoglycan/LPS O-acetylase OafA/YrhL